MKKILALTLIASLIASPVLAAQDAAQKQEAAQDSKDEKKKENKVWHVIKNYVLPGAGIICGALMLRWGWKRWNRSQATVWILRTGDDFKKLDEIYDQLGHGPNENVAEIKAQFKSKDELQTEAARLKNTKHTYIVLAIPNTYAAANRSHREGIGINIDRRNPNRPMYIFTNIQNRAASCNVEPVRDFFATYDPSFDTSRI